MGGYKHTVQLLDVMLYKNDQSEVCIALVLDYHSKDLRRILDKSDKIIINDEHIIKVLYSLLCALKFVHQANIMHRDVKPANLLFQKNCHVVLCDFGLARTTMGDLPREPPADRNSIAQAQI
mmetsp:Transcript_29501/g.44837  ORF Transcript_29501/g.44837 Transcript_29501/m.44837 type:complete len:122 (+) Transcript_29501:288-653(+)